MSGLLLATGFTVRADPSLLRGKIISRDGDGNLRSIPRGVKGTLRPDIIITQRINGQETIVMILDPNTGNSRISKSWRSGLQKLVYDTNEKMDAIVGAIRVSGFVVIEKGDLPWD